jgi:hypothetical protein
MKNFTRANLIIFLILILGAFLRFYKIDENLVFHGELGHNYLAIKNTLGKGILPLLGPPTSHIWLSFGPLFYYIFGPFLILNRYNPNTGAYFFAVFSILGIIANYLIIKKLFNQKIALISSYLIAISPTWLDLARQARFFSMVAYLFYPFFLLTEKTVRNANAKNFFLLGLIFGIMINFHLAPIFLLLALFIIFRKTKLKFIFFGLIGFIIPNIPFLIYNFKTHFEMITKFAVWIPYRSAIYHNFNLRFTANVIWIFFGGLLIFPIVITIYIERRNKIVRILTLFLIFGVLALILHKDPPSHYFYVLYGIPVILISILLTKLNNFLMCTILILITVMSFTNKIKDNNVPYKKQLEITKQIIGEANGRPFNIHRIGLSDQFDGGYAQNYKYLLWWMGNEPKDYPTGLTYTISEACAGKSEACHCVITEK